MNSDLRRVLDAQHGVATSAQILAHSTRRRFEKALTRGTLTKIWHGVYCSGEPDDALRLRGLDLAAGVKVTVCMGTAAALFGFDTEDTKDFHVLDPRGHQLRHADGLVIHRRDGAPLADIDGRPATAPAWTAVEVARGLRRPRALATLDAALRSGSCTRSQLCFAAQQQAGRRGIVAVRDLVPHTVSNAESPMESEVRLVIIDSGLPMPVLQYEVLDGNRELRRLDFAWPDAMVAVDYDGFDWHSNPAALTRDRQRLAALQDAGWVVISITIDDVRYRSWDFLLRLERQLCRARAA